MNLWNKIKQNKLFSLGLLINIVILINTLAGLSRLRSYEALGSNPTSFSEVDYLLENMILPILLLGVFYLFYYKIPKDSWIIWGRVLFVGFSSIVFINIPISIVLGLTGICVSGNAFSSSCTNGLAQFSYSIATGLQIMMIVFFAPLIIWLASTVLAVFNRKKISNSQPQFYGQQLLHKINLTSLVLLLLPLPIFVLLFFGLIVRYLQIL